MITAIQLSFRRFRDQTSPLPRWIVFSSTKIGYLPLVFWSSFNWQRSFAVLITAHKLYQNGCYCKNDPVFSLNCFKYGQEISVEPFVSAQIYQNKIFKSRLFICQIHFGSLAQNKGKQSITTYLYNFSFFSFFRWIYRYICRNESNAAQFRLWLTKHRTEVPFKMERFIILQLLAFLIGTF